MSLMRSSGLALSRTTVSLRSSAAVSASTYLNSEGLIPSVIVANNLYYDFQKTRELGELVAGQALAQGKRVVVLVLGGLSGSEFRDQREMADDDLANATEDHWNRRILKAIEARDVEGVLRQLPEFIREAHADMGFKHLAFALGALGALGEAKTYAYGPLYGSGAAVVRLL